MKKYENVMLDLETLGTGAGAVIISIAAIPFSFRESPLTKIEVGDVFFQMNVNPDTCIAIGMHTDFETLQWWGDKPDVARMLKKDQESIRYMVASFTGFWNERCDENTKLWGKGPSFDCTILASAYRLLGYNIPWKYYNERCVRTYLDGYERSIKENVEFIGVPHMPFSDANHQIRCMKHVYGQTHILP